MTKDDYLELIKSHRKKLNCIDKLLLETDGPYQSLHQGSEAYTWFIVEQLQHLEKITGYPMAEQIYQNSLEFIKC